MDKIKNGIWKNLFQFPMIESKKELNKTQVLSNEIFKSIAPISNSDIRLFNSRPIIMELIIHKNNFSVIRKEDTVLNQISREKIPSWVSKIK